MENVGAVTFTDRVLKPADERTNQTDLIHAYIHLHELAHMWFGDLTTMRWWNDLWLKESFADFCAVTCMSETPSIRARYPDPELLLLRFIARALAADLSPTTHPIQVPIKHTGDATSAFDAISYEKGASWIKTTDSFVGRNVLQKGLAAYVTKFAYKNSTLDDLVQCLKDSVQEHGTGKEGNFSEWTNDWLKKSGVNTLKLDWSNAGTLDIVQGFSKFGDKQLRSQRIDVLLMFDDKSSIVLKNIMVEKAERTQDILSQVSAEIRTAFKTKCQGPNDKVYGLVNANNKGYCRVLMSEQELIYFGQIMDQLDTVNRCYVWRILFDHVKMGQLKIENFWSIFFDKIKSETNEEVVLYLLQKISWLKTTGFIDSSRFSIGQ